MADTTKKAKAPAKPRKTAVKKEKVAKKDPHFVVSKGNIIEHYEDDMDVPTFLRKQMQ